MKPSKGEQVLQVLLAFLKSACYLALFLGMQVLVMVPVTVSLAIRAALEHKTIDEDAVYALIEGNTMTFSLISGLLTLMAILIFYRGCGKKPSEALWIRRVPAPTLWEGAALAPGLYFVVAMALFALPEAWLESYSEASAGLDSGGVLGVLAVVVVAPVVEEFIFRGLIMTRLSKAMPGWLAILLSAAIFGLCHGHPVWFAYAFVLGAVFGLMDWRAGSIWPSILGHVAFNAIGQIFTFLRQIFTSLPETESGAGELAGVMVLAAVAVAAPIVDRRAVASLFRPTRRRDLRPEWGLAMAPGVYEFNPWDE